MWLEIRCSNQKFLLAVAYRTDDQGNFWDILQESYIRAVRLGIHYIIITGDLNADPSTHHGNKLMEFIEANNLTKLINVPTRITETSASELDQILTNCSSIIQEVDLLPPVSYNDHHTVSVRLNFKIAKPHSYNRLMWDFGRADYMAFRAKIAQTNWETCFDYDDIDCVAQNWTDTLLNIARETIPNKMVTVRPWDKPFYNGYLRRLRRNKNRAHNLAKSDNTSTAWQQFRVTRNFYFSEIKRLKFEHEQKLLSSMKSTLTTNPRKWWSFSKKLFGNSQTGIPTLNDNGIIITNDLDKANSFNNFFKQTATLDDSNAVLPPDYPTLCDSTLETFYVEEADTRNYLQKLNANKAFGPDGISPKLLKEGSSELAPSLTKLFNRSLQDGKFPKLWKRANVIPLHKKQARSILTNYRPVSLLSTVGKVMEKLVFKRLFDYFRENFLISLWQSGFLPCVSTVTHMTEMYHSFCKAVENGKELRIVFCDISKAFDRVWHNGLLYKLEKGGITNSALAWIKNYLQDRYQRVVINGQASNWVHILAGVPQGSVLGPLLFLIFINDITHVIRHCQIRLFADDTSLFIEVDNRERAAQLMDDDLVAVTNWAKSWLVTFSPPKTEALIISTKPRIEEHPPLHMDGSILKEVLYHKHVGITISRDLSWHRHISNVTVQARSAVNRLRPYKFKLDRRSLELIYISSIRPLMEYGDVVWAGGNIGDLEKLESIQIDAARVITGATARCSTSLLFKDVG
jgi:hypothetical protein